MLLLDHEYLLLKQHSLLVYMCLCCYRQHITVQTGVRAVCGSNLDSSRGQCRLSNNCRSCEILLSVVLINKVWLYFVLVGIIIKFVVQQIYIIANYCYGYFTPIFYLNLAKFLSLLFKSSIAKDFVNENH